MPGILNNPSSNAIYEREGSGAALSPVEVYVYPYVGENLLLRSQEFEHAAWTKNATTIGGTTTGPDGTLAQKVAETAAEQAHSVSQIPTGFAEGDPLLLAISAKAVERVWLAVIFDAPASVEHIVWFNVSTGAIGVTDSACTAQVEAEDNGFFRCSVLLSGASNRQVANGGNGIVNKIRFATSPGGNGVHPFAVGTAGSGLYLWGAQLARAQTFVPYNRSVAAAVGPKAGLTLDPATEYGFIPIAGGGLELAFAPGSARVRMTMVGEQIRFDDYTQLP